MSARTKAQSVLDIIRATVFGGATLNTASVWAALGYYSRSAVATYTEVQVPSGKTFKLWALGQMSCAKPDNTDIRACKVTGGVEIKALGKGVYFSEYKSPYTAVGPCLVRLEGWQDFDGGIVVNGFMNFSIEKE